MLKPIYSTVVQAVTLIEDVKKLKANEKELRQELKEIAELVRDWRHEQLRDRELAQRDRENLQLRLENAFLRSGASLPAMEVPAIEAGTQTETEDDLRQRVAALEQANEELRRRVEELERKRSRKISS
jgi:hypothetical protein